MADVEVTGSSHSWTAWAGARRIGELRALTRPDQRCHLVFRDCDEAAYRPLVERAAGEIDGDLHTTVDEADPRARRRFGDLGFTVARHERHYRLPTDPARLGLTGGVTPPGVDLVSAADADPDRLRELDDALRQDIPGSDNWRWDREGFLAQLSGNDFNPATYLVATRRDTGGYVGLVRVWMNRDGPRLGCLAVLPAYRRTRITYALVAAVTAVLHERGHPTVVTEIDATNRAANALLAGRGALRAGGSYELVRRAGAGPSSNADPSSNAGP